MAPSITSAILRVKATAGSSLGQWRENVSRLKAWIHRHDFIIGVGFAVFALFLVFVLAITDFTRSAKTKDQEIQSTTLSRELSYFFLRTRDLDGVSLLENASELSKEQRQLKIISVKRPFFTYFLTRGNVRSFDARNLNFEPPRACSMDFRARRHDGSFSGQVIQACFAAVPDDASGRYVYFTIRFRGNPLRLHKRGRPLAESDRIEVAFQGVRSTRVILVPELPYLVSAQHPSRRSRFDGVHEMAAFPSDDVGRPTYAVNAQAYERAGGGDSEVSVTVLGRIDATLLIGSTEKFSDWPSAQLKALQVGIQIIPANMDRTIGAYGFAPTDSGHATFSLERVYRSTVLSNADLVVTTLGATPEKPSTTVWRSSDIEESQRRGQDGVFQWIGEILAQIFFSGRERISVDHLDQVSGMPGLRATLTADAVVIPDIAARALAWLVVGAMAIGILGPLMLTASGRVQRLTRAAYDAALKNNADGLKSYERAEDQIGSLGRALFVLYQRLELEHSRRQDDVVRRQSILQAIGHEIKTPLGNLKETIRNDSREYRELLRMERAVMALYEANKIEEGLRKGDIVLGKYDLALYLSSLATGKQRRGMSVRYLGLLAPIPAVFDEIVLESVLDQLIENAERYVIAGSDIEIRLTFDEQSAFVEVFNAGPPIQNPKQIFELGVSDRTGENNLGLGLYAAKIRIEAMRGEIRAENRSDGVAFVLTLLRHVELT